MPQLPQDKANHLIYGLLIFLAFGYALGALIGVAAACFAGVFKEVYDKVSGKGTPDVYDFVATAAGGFLGFLCTFVAVGARNAL